MDVLVVGNADPAAALTSALSERGIDASLHAVGRASGDRAVQLLADTMVELERKLEAERPRLAVAVGLGDAPLALAVGAAKLGVPLVAWIDGQAPPASALEEGEERIMRTLASFEATSVGDGAQAIQAAERIAAWANLD